jgi:hypothetical protein
LWYKLRIVFVSPLIPVHWHTLSYTSMVSFHFLFFQGLIVIRNCLCGMDQNYLRKKWAY